MELHIHDNPTLTVALALAAGMLGQAVAAHLRLPGIVILIALGAVLGPDVANLVQPESLGSGLMGLVGFAVAVILFEGGMSLDLRRLKREQRAIRQLITLGALVSMGVGALLVAIAMGWGWERSLLFGTLLIVTGPTVVTPLVRRLRVKKTVATVLEAEGVLIDAVGAITAAVALELVLHPTGTSWALAAPTIAGRLGFGIVFGLVGGGVLGLLLRFRGLIPEGLENTFTLGWAVLVFQLSNAIVHESGIAAVTVAGLVVGNVRIHVQKELAEFKEQLTVMLIGMLFVLLVADVRFDDVIALGWPGLIVAIGAIVLVRPLSVVAGTWRTTLTTKERVFIGWIGPRGIVAAAVASLFGYQLEQAGIAGGVELRALTFLVIAVTVVWSALSGGIAAHFLGLRRKAGAGWVVLGANAVGRALGSLLVEVGSEVLLIDHHDGLVKAAEDEGLRALSLNALEATTGEKAQLDTRIGALSVTSNEEVNFLFAEKSRLRVKTIRYPVALRSWLQGVTPEMVRQVGGELLFGAEVDIALWAERLDAGTAAVWWWTFNGGRNRPSILTGGQPDPTYLPLVHKRRSNAEPVTDQVRFRKKSEVAFLVDLDAKAAAEQTLRAAGWEPSGKPRKRTRVEKPTEPAAPEPADAAPSNAPADEPSAAAPEDAA
jgi:NhaP-type Na+/H+ or K+/H+ antiporter